MGSSLFQTIIDMAGARGAIADAVCMRLSSPVIIIIYKKTNKQVHKKFGIFNQSRDHSTSMKSTGVVHDIKSH